MPKLLNKKRKIILFFVIINAFLQATLVGVFSYVLKNIYDSKELDFTIHSDPTANIWLAILITLLIASLKIIERIHSETLGQDYVIDIRVKLFKRYSSLSSNSYDKLRKGLVFLRFANDLNSLKLWLSHGISRLSVSMVLLIVTVLALFFINTYLAMSFLILSLFNILFLFLAGRFFDQRVREVRNIRGKISGNISEKIENIDIVQAFAQRKAEESLVKQHSQQLKEAMISKTRISGLLRGISYFFSSITIVVLLVIGNWAVSEGLTTKGDVAAALTITFLISPSFIVFSRAFEHWKTYQIAKSRTEKLLKKGKSIKVTNPVSLQEFKGDLELRNINVTNVIESFSGNVVSGNVAIIKGANGSGKTTLLKLILRLNDPNSGEIFLDNTNIKNIKTGSLRRQVSIASISQSLFRGTIQFNIGYGSSKSRLKDIVMACELCGLDYKSPNSPYYLKKTISENGTNISDGEKMRIILARALVSRPKVLLLDQPERFLDSLGFSSLKDMILNYKGTIVLATNNADLTRMGDVIWQL